MCVSSNVQQHKKGEMCVCVSPSRFCLRDSSPCCCHIPKQHTEHLKDVIDKDTNDDEAHEYGFFHLGPPALLRLAEAAIHEFIAKHPSKNYTYWNMPLNLLYEFSFGRKTVAQMKRANWNYQPGDGEEEADAWRMDILKTALDCLKRSNPRAWEVRFMNSVTSEGEFLCLCLCHCVGWRGSTQCSYGRSFKLSANTH